MAAHLSEQEVKRLMGLIQPAKNPIIVLDSDATSITVTKPSGTSSTLNTVAQGFYMGVSNQPIRYTQADATLSTMYARMRDDYGWPVGYYCARCDERISYDRDGYRKNRGKPAWLHLKTTSPWCAKTKQHGPKTRWVLPVPSLYVINEIGYLHA